MASARDGDGNNYVPFNKNMVNGLVLNNCPMNWLKDSDPINDRNSDGYGAKHDSGGNLMWQDQYGNKITDWYPDMFKTKDGNCKNWCDYDPSCIHVACPDKSNIIWNDYTWYCN